MSIIQQLTNTNPATLSAMCTKQQFVVSSISTPEQSVITQYLDDCDEPLIVFSHATNNLKNDYSLMVGTQPANNGTFEFWLMDENCNNIVQFTDNTFGTFYAAGSFTGDGQEYYSAFIVDWNLVYNTYGGGIYKLKTVKPLPFFGGGITVDQCSCKFLLMPFSDAEANETVRIEVVFNSYYINSGEDFRGMNLKQMFRIPGNFGKLDPQIEKDNYKNTSRVITDIQETIYNEYTLETYAVPYCFSSYIVPTKENNSLASIADEIYITNYNLSKHFDLQRVPVVVKDIKLTNEFNSSKAFYEITFEDRERRNVKRSVR